MKRVEKSIINAVLVRKENGKSIAGVKNSKEGAEIYTDNLQVSLRI